MSFFSSLFSSVSRGTSEENLEKARAEFPDLYTGMSVDLLTTEGKTLLSGRVTAFSETEMTIERLPGWLAFEVFNVGMSVCVRGYSRGMQPFNMTASIQESSRVICKLKDLKSISVIEHRSNFRLPVRTSASLFYPNDKHFSNPENCTLIDISVGGACFESEYLHAEDEVLRLRVKLEEYKPMDFLGQVIRVTELKSGSFQYGFLFAQLKEDEQAELTKTLYNIQVGQKKEWRRREKGEWG